MTNESKWKEANRQLMAEARRALGDPPTAEEMEAYSRGELPEPEADRIRDLLVAYPELARVYSEPFPEAALPNEEGYVSEAQTDAGWAALQTRLGKTSTVEPPAGGHVIRFPQVLTSMAAALAIVFAGLYVHAEGKARRFERLALTEPMVLEANNLPPDGSRGGDGPTVVERRGNVYVLEPQIIGQKRYAHYRLELLDANGTTLWRNYDAMPDEDGAFLIVVPSAMLPGGTYRIAVFGIDANKPEALIGKYSVSVPL